jgi:CxC2 like cysteine cluster associated with KDZ transposases
VSTHERLPFHRIQMWNGRFFERSDLLTRGLCLNLCHYPDDCPCLPLNAETQAMFDLDTFDGAKGIDDGYHPSEPSEPTAQYKTRSDLTIVSSTGIFTCSVRWCTCTKSPDQCVQLLLRAKLFPASFKNPKTVFTFEVLDHFRIDALECKTAAMNFMSKLGRITNEAFPSQVPVSGPMVGWCSHIYDMVQDRYRELLRVSRQWRDLHNRIRAGVVHDRPDHPVEGGLALFCPACPQMDINIPPETEWKSDDR